MSTKHSAFVPIVTEKVYNYYSNKDVESWPPKSPTYEQIEEMKKWCRNHVGNNNWNYYGLYRKVPCEFRFKRSEDCLAFKMTFLM